MVALVGADPDVDQVLVFYDHPPGLAGASAESWQAVEDGILDGARASPVPVLVAATLPELLDDTAAWRFAEAGVPAIAGLRTGLACAAALQAPPPDAARLREMAAAARAARFRRQPPTAPPPATNGAPPRGRWLAEHEAKDLLRAAQRSPSSTAASSPARTTPSPRSPSSAASSPSRRRAPTSSTRPRSGLLALGVAAEPDVRAAWRSLARHRRRARRAHGRRPASS